MTVIDGNDARAEIRAVVEDLLRGVGEGPDASAPAAWRSLSDYGFTSVGVPERLGGAGGTDVAALAVIEAAAAAGVAIPLLEHLWLGGWALAAGGIALPVGRCTFSVADVRVERSGDGWRIAASASDVPCLSESDYAVLLSATGTVVAVPVDAVSVHEGRDLAGRPLDRLDVDGLRVENAMVAATVLTPEAAALRVAVGRLHQIAAAARVVLGLAVEHVRIREQFGRPLAAFQAVQQRLAVAAGEVSMLELGSSLALQGSPTDVAMARVDAARSVPVITREAHQIFGAMGVTAEHVLGSYTRSMRAWLASTGADAQWHRRVAAACEAGLWNTVVGEQHE